MALLRVLPLLAFLVSAAAAVAPTFCPLLGANYPAPASLATRSEFQQGIKAFEELLANSTGATSNNSAYSISVSSAVNNQTLYELHYTPPNVKNATHGVHSVDADSIYRVGSLSKVFTMYTLLRLIGDARLNDPITKYIPELLNEQQPPLPFDTVYDDINSVDWSSITLGNLASQIAGIERDVAGDIAVSLTPEEVAELGFPKLNASLVPTCGEDVAQPPCTREQFFQLLLPAHPYFASSHTPSYSNNAFELLALAIQNITGQSDFGGLVQDTIFEPLDMSHSSYSAPKSSNGGVIPGGNITTTQWAWDLGVDAPGGGMYLSTKDLATVCRAIMSSTLLDPALTRRWLKPYSNTASLTFSVGAPWEINRFTMPNGRILDLYTKNGDVGLYNAQMILSVDHQLAITIMTAGDDGATILTDLTAALANTIIPAAEAGARAEANHAYAGTYTDKTSNSSVVIGTDQGGGLTMSNLTSRGAPTIDLLAAQLQLPGTIQPRLYPSGLRSRSRASSFDSTNPTCVNGTYTSRTGWRAVFVPTLPVPDGDEYTQSCDAWLTVGIPTYEGHALDDVIFSLGENGEAVAVELRGLGLNLKRQQ